MSDTETIDLSEFTEHGIRTIKVKIPKDMSNATLPMMPTKNLRDYFAVRASEEDIKYWQDKNNCTREEAKYAYADAMMEARK